MSPRKSRVQRERDDYFNDSAEMHAKLLKLEARGSLENKVKKRSVFKDMHKKYIDFRRTLACKKMFNEEYYE